MDDMTNTFRSRGYKMWHSVASLLALVVLLSIEPISAHALDSAESLLQRCNELTQHASGTKKWQEAYSVCERARRARPQEVQLLITLGNLALKLDRPSQALQSCQTYLKQTQDDKQIALDCIEKAQVKIGLLKKADLEARRQKLIADKKASDQEKQAQVSAAVDGPPVHRNDGEPKAQDQKLAAKRDARAETEKSPAAQRQAFDSKPAIEPLGSSVKPAPSLMPSVIAPRAGGDPPPPLYKRWWLWTAVGGVVAAGITIGMVCGLGKCGGGADLSDVPPSFRLDAH